jgi:hypothetical protein
MAKIILTLIMCSYSTGQCLPPYQYPNEFNDMYDCMMTGYLESIKKTEEFGRDQINQHGIYIKFGCTQKQTV